MRFRDLGGLEVEVDNQSHQLRGHLAAVLGTLLMHRDRRVSVDQLVDAVWGDVTTDRSATTLETHVWRLRRILEPHRSRGQPATVLVNDTGGYRLVATTNQIDSARFEQLNLDVLDMLTTGQCQRALTAAESALSMWRGEPFSAIADRPWSGGPIARLQETRTQLQERRIDALLGIGRSAQAIADLEELLAENPYRERLWWQRMLALHRNGRTESALQTYQRARRTLLDEIGLEPGHELVELERQILQQDPRLRLPESPEPARPVRAVELRLPRSKPLVGRATELVSVTQLLRLGDLVTITGTAGCGKTLLATEAARREAESFPDGVYFIDLSAAETATDITVAITTALGLVVAEASGPVATLADFARDRRALLVLDNCEQILEQIAGLAEGIADASHQLTLLVTSREPLGVSGENVYVLDPLPVSAQPDTESSNGSSEPAVELFLARARFTGRPSSDDLADIRQICRAVDGIPLAIELAAALSSTFSLREIADHVDQHPSQLAAVGRGQQRHHQTLVTAIDRSHRLLSAEEQVLYRRLAVLPGSFGRELAEAVVGPELQEALPGQLARLVHRSLLTSSRSDEGTRFVLLAPIRSHAFQILRSHDEVERADRLRDAWITDLVTSRPGTGNADEARWHARVLVELPSLRATLDRRLVHAPDAVGVELSNQLLGFWYYLDRLAEGLRWAEAARATAPEENLLGIKARLTLASILALRSQADRSVQVLDEALALLADPTSDGFRLAGHPQLTSDQQLEVTELLIATSTAFAVVRDAERMRAPLRLIEQTKILSHSTDLALAHEATCCLYEVVAGPDDRTLEAARSTFDRASRQGNLWAGWLAASCASSIALMRRDATEGLVWSRRTIDQQGRMGARTVMAQVETFGDFLALDGRLVEAVRVFAASRHQARRAGHPWPRNALTTELLERCRLSLSTADFSAAWALGPSTDRRELIAATGASPSA